MFVIMNERGAFVVELERHFFQIRESVAYALCVFKHKPEHAKAHELFGDALSCCGKEEEAAIHWAIAETLREKRKGR